MGLCRSPVWREAEVGAALPQAKPASVARYLPYVRAALAAGPRHEQALFEGIDLPVR